MILYKKTTIGADHYEVTRAGEVDKILGQTSISKDPAAGTLGKD